MISSISMLANNKFCISFFLIELGILLIHGSKMAFVGGCLLATITGLYKALERLQKIDPKLPSILCLSLFFAGAFMLHGWYVPLMLVLLLPGMYLYFSSLKILLSDHFAALFLLTTTIIGCSFVPEQYQLYAIAICLIGSLAIILFNGPLFQKLCTTDWQVIQSLEIYDIVCWELIFFSINFLGFFHNNNFYCLDKFHPLYELSIGHSFKHNVFNALDISYVGRVIKFHFLSTRIPLFFSNILNISLLDAVYFVTPIFFSLIIFMLIQYFFLAYKRTSTPAFMLVFFPLIGVAGSFECLFKTVSCLVPTSYFLGFILMMLGTVFLMQEKIILLFLCASVLLLTKASFFMTLVGGIVLYFLRQADIKKLFSIMLPLGIVFLIVYPQFLSGAHAHNLWMLYPTPWFCCNEKFLELIFFLVTVTCSLYVYLKYSEHKDLCVLAAVSLSGAIGISLLTEVSELNSYQFVIAAFFATSIIIGYVLKQIILEPNFFKRWLLVFIGPAQNDAIRNGQINLCQLLTKSIIAFVIFESLIFYFYPIFTNVRTAVFLPEKEVFISSDHITAYTWLGKNTTQTATVLFAKHYETHIKDFWPHTGFLRSALSGRQMFCENSRFKGIMMEPDFAQRCWLSMLFYKTFIIPSKKSEMMESLFFDQDFGKNPGIPLSQSPREHMRLWHTLSFGKEWFAFNTQQQIEYDIAQNLHHKTFTQDDAITFLKNFKITHIALENNDQPSLFVTTIAQKVYQNQTISFWEVGLT